jgi:hypothetical protein
MSTAIKPPPQRGRLERALEALFREARLLERRRRRRRALAVLAAAVVVGAGAYLIAGGGGGSSTNSSGRPLAGAHVSSVALPLAGHYDALGVVGGRLIVSGGAAGSLFPSGSTTSLSHGRPAGTCDAATVNPATLRPTGVRQGDCADPALYGERVLAVSYLAGQVSATNALGVLALRIARSDPSAPGGYTLGPVVMRYPQCSDCGADWIYGDGSLWIYDSVSSGGAELLRVSQSTGAVAQRIAMPSIDRPYIAVNADGLWLADSNESGFPLHVKASQYYLYESLYRVAPGMRAPERELTIGHWGALWLLASGHSVWLDISRVPRVSLLLGLTGPHARRRFAVSYPAIANDQLEPFEGGRVFAGSAADGLWYIARGPSPGDPVADNGPQRVVEVSPASGAGRTVATVASADNSEVQPPAVVFDGSFYFLEPPTYAAIYPYAPIGRSRLYRATPRRA